MDTIFSAGEVIPFSGTYVVTHLPPHVAEQTIALQSGRKFPFCVDCRNVSFMLVTLNDFANVFSAPLEL